MEVEIYRNLHKNVWSVRDKRTGRVVHHADQCIVKNATFVVQPAGRAKVVREQRKNVHAFVRGTYNGPNLDSWDRSDYNTQVSYNPYKAGHFTDIEGNQVKGTHGLVLLDTNGKAFIQRSDKPVDGCSLWWE